MVKFLQEFTQRINQCLVGKNCQKPIEFSGGQCCPPFEKLEPELKFRKCHAGNIEAFVDVSVILLFLFWFWRDCHVDF